MNNELYNTQVPTSHTSCVIGRFAASVSHSAYMATTAHAKSWESILYQHSRQPSCTHATLPQHSPACLSWLPARFPPWHLPHWWSSSYQDSCRSRLRLRVEFRPHFRNIVMYAAGAFGWNPGECVYCADCLFVLSKFVSLPARPAVFQWPFNGGSLHTNLDMYRECTNTTQKYHNIFIPYQAQSTLIFYDMWFRRGRRHVSLFFSLSLPLYLTRPLYSDPQRHNQLHRIFCADGKNHVLRCSLHGCIVRLLSWLRGTDTGKKAQVKQVKKLTCGSILGRYRPARNACNIEFAAVVLTPCIMPLLPLALLSLLLLRLAPLATAKFLHRSLESLGLRCGRMVKWPGVQDPRAWDRAATVRRRSIAIDSGPIATREDAWPKTAFFLLFAGAESTGFVFLNRDCEGLWISAMWRIQLLLVVASSLIGRCCLDYYCAVSICMKITRFVAVFAYFAFFPSMFDGMYRSF